jgi:hypothetical protein
LAQQGDEVVNRAVGVADGENALWEHGVVLVRVPDAQTSQYSTTTQSNQACLQCFRGGEQRVKSDKHT